MKKLLLSSAAALILGVSMAQAQSRGADLLVINPHTGMQVRLSSLDTSGLTAEEIAILAQQLKALSPQDRQKIAAAIRDKMDRVLSMAGEHAGGMGGHARGMDDAGDNGNDMSGDGLDMGRSDGGMERADHDMAGQGDDAMSGTGGMGMGRGN